MNATIDKDIHRAIGFLEAGQTGEALACVRTVDAACEASHLRCNGLPFRQAKFPGARMVRSCLGIRGFMEFFTLTSMAELGRINRRFIRCFQTTWIQLASVVCDCYFRFHKRGQ